MHSYRLHQRSAFISPDVFVSLPSASFAQQPLALHCEISGNSWQQLEASGKDNGGGARPLPANLPVSQGLNATGYRRKSGR
jgi:hypothetical protein